MIIGIGVDLVHVSRFARSLERTPALLPRLFAESERGLSVRSLAARFAAKEALIKAIGHSTGFRWHDMVVVPDAERNPAFVLTGGVRLAADTRGIRHVHLSMTHDGDTALAFVIAESEGGGV